MHLEFHANQIRNDEGASIIIEQTYEVGSIYVAIRIHMRSLILQPCGVCELKNVKKLKKIER